MIVASQDGPNVSTLLGKLDELYLNSRTGYYQESDQEKFPCYNWGVGVTLSALNSAARVDPANMQRLKAYLEKVDTYWNPQGPIPGYDVQPNKTHNQDRYYDDNAWMVMALVESYEITQNSRWLKRAEAALTYVLSGEDDKLGGGIFWKEREKTSKNTCSNGPSAVACLAVYAKNQDPNLLKKAEQIYAWTRKNLQAPDGLYWDNIKLDGTVEKTKWSYNSALMLRTAKELSRCTKHPTYQQDAEGLEAACIKRWVKSDGTIDDELQFAHLLFENLDPKKFDAQQCIEKLLLGRDSEGFFGNRWGKPSKGKHQLLHQASAVRAIATYELLRRRR